MIGINIEVNIDKLVDTLKANRDQHIKDYEKAKKGWVKLLRKELVAKLDTLDNGGELKLTIENQKPETHVSDYDEVIEMLEFASSSTIDLDPQTYRQFVKDDWQWKRWWAASTATYIASA